MNTLIKKTKITKAVFVLSFLVTMTSFNVAEKNKFNENKTAVCPMEFSVNSTVTLDFASVEDSYSHELTNTNFTSWSDFTLDFYGNATFTIDFPSNNPAGTLILKRSGTQIQSLSIPANTTAIYFLSDTDLLCGVTYEVIFS